jgi:hypothetical protein
MRCHHSGLPEDSSVILKDRNTYANDDVTSRLFLICPRWRAKASGFNIKEPEVGWRLVLNSTFIQSIGFHERASKKLSPNVSNFTV